jgi:hypothetical protein
MEPVRGGEERANLAAAAGGTRLTGGFQAVYVACSEISLSGIR